MQFNIDGMNVTRIVDAEGSINYVKVLNEDGEDILSKLHLDDCNNILFAMEQLVSSEWIILKCGQWTVKLGWESNEK